MRKINGYTVFAILPVLKNDGNIVDGLRHRRRAGDNGRRRDHPRDRDCVGIHTGLHRLAPRPLPPLSPTWRGSQSCSARRDVPSQPGSDSGSGGSVSAELIGRIMEANLAQTHSTVDRLIANLDREVAEHIAILETVRTDIYRLVSGDYMPTPSAIHRALYPDSERVKSLTEDILTERGISVQQNA